ncbi:glycosyltransferase [uncultured Prevotella sp.]|uniref:glycosyltransferase n=1 Tax=uncultured Prevotella sp. TaxID=159272 RepID=UPI0025864416|nr:glycosyltransferase [uncultured Prevotella sp.]
MERQIFQTDSRRRWRRFKWTMRFFATIMVLLLVVFITMFAMEGSPNLPFHHDYRSALTASKPFMKDNKTAQSYQALRDKFLESRMHNNYMDDYRRDHRFVGHGDKVTEKFINEWGDPRIGVRAAWYVNWDTHSLTSLKRGMKQLNMVIPEWFFINPATDRLETRIDNKALREMRQAGVPVLPMLTNNYGGDFNPQAIGRIMSDKNKRDKFVSSLLATCHRYHFEGINIDLEELNITDNALLTNFVAELYRTFHANNMYVTQDVMPFNDDYDMQQLARYNDYLFLMAYDEHNTTSAPGDVASQHWMEKATDWAAKNIPNDKLVLGLAGYGYDWAAGGDCNTVSYDQAIANAYGADATILFDDDTYNLHYSYTDDDNVKHQVYFTDAATIFNNMRFGTTYHLAGFAMWRLGTEDSRVWNFYGKDLAWEQVKRWNLNNIFALSGYNDVNYVGSGEVLSVESEPHPGHVSLSIDTDDQLIAEENYITLPSAYTVAKLGHCGPKDLILTFDDGPDARWTPQVLRTLKHYGVPGAFFMVGLQMEKNLPLVKKVYDAGNTIGNHTFTHHNVIENSDDRTYAELKLTRMLVESITGHSTTLFRAPYNADADPTQREEIEPMILASRRNYLFVGEEVDPNDWQPGITADEIYRRVIDGVHHGDGHIILLHDAGGVTRKPTMEALPRIIATLQHEGYRFISLEKYLGMSRQQLMPEIPKGETYYAMQANLTLAEIIYHTSDFLTALFVVFLVLGFLRLAFMYFLMIKEKRAEHRRHYPALTKGNAPHVSIIVPAYNEEVNCVRTVSNLLKEDYPSFDVIFVDDGSKDHTLERIHEAFDGNQRVQILGKANGGKASALNYGIAHTTAEYVVCIDADTQLRPDAVSRLMQHFILDNAHSIGAVAGNVKVGNQRNMLTRWQAIEYTTSQNFDRMAYSYINAITVVPGAIGAFRKEAIEKAGGLTTDTLAEDCDLTMRINEAGYRIENESYAVAMTEAPENVRQFVKQRVRWCFGVMQTFWKHRASLFNAKKKGFGLWAMPNILVFQYIIPTFSPLADVLMFIGLFSGNAMQIFLYYLLFLLVDASVSIMAYIFEHEKLWVLLWIIPQRFFYRWIMYFVLFKSYIKAIKGELQSWGVLKRTGHVKA